MVGIMNTFGSCFGGESTQTPEKKQSQTQVEQCNLILNVLYSDDKQKTSSENVKRERFLKKRKYLEKMGMLKGKRGTTKQKPKKFKSSLVSNETASSTNVPQLREKMATGALSNKKVIFKSDMVNSSESENKQHSPNNKISKSSINSSQPGDSSKQSAASSTNTIKPSGSGEFNFLIVPNKKVFFKYELLNPPVSEGVPESNCRAINLLRNLNIPTLPPAVINPSKYVAIDCEMVGGGPNGQLSMLARCSIVSYDGDVMFDKFIKPVLPITDYRTRWSGIRPSTLARAIPFEEAKKQILKLLRSKVVIGHAIHNDFKALGYFHPASHTRDTQKIPLLNLKGGFHVDKIISLKNMSKTILKNDIQMGKDGHSSVEDAQATMKLYRTVASDWEKVLASGFDFWGKLESLKDQNPGENVGNQ